MFCNKNKINKYLTACSKILINQNFNTVLKIDTSLITIGIFNYKHFDDPYVKQRK